MAKVSKRAIKRIKETAAAAAKANGLTVSGMEIDYGFEFISYVKTECGPETTVAELAANMRPLINLCIFEEKFMKPVVEDSRFMTKEFSVSWPQGLEGKDAEMVAGFVKAMKAIA